MSFPFSNPNSPQTRVAVPPIVAQIDPVTGPSAQQYPIGTVWINTVSNIVFTLTSFSNGVANWIETSPASAGSFTSLTVTPGPTAIAGEFRVNGNVNEAEVIRLRENGGTSGTIEIASLQGTGADSISIQSTSGGIEIATDAAAKDVAISASLGSIGIVAGENIQDALIIQADGGAASGLLIENTSGTGSGSAAAAAIGVLATDGAVYVDSAAAIAGAIVLDASNAAGGMLLNSGTNGTSLTSTGDIDLNTSAGAINFTAGGGITYTITGDVDLDITGAISLDATLASNFTVTGAAADLTLSSAGGSVNVTATEAVADAIFINASAGGVEITSSANTAINTTGAGTTSIGSIATGGAVLIESASSITLEPVTTLTMAPTAAVTTIDLGNITPTVNRTTTINGAAVAAAHTDTLNLATGGVNTNAGASKVVNIASGANLLGTQTVNVATGTAASGTKTVNIGNVDGLSAINAYGVVGINNSTSVGATNIGNVGAGGAVAINSSTTITSLAPNVNINNSSTGATTIGSATGGTIIAESNTASAVAIQLNAHNAAGGITATVGTNNFNVSGGNIVIPTAGKGVTLTPAPATPASLLAGAGDPNGVVTAGLGSLYMNVTGSGVADRLWVNSDAGTTWVAVTTVS